MDGTRSDWENTHDSTLWHELLLPFIVVKKLHIGSSLTLELSKALQSVPEGLVLELLPKLQELDVQLEVDDAKMEFSAFLHTRESLGRPVALSVSSFNFQLIIHNALDAYKKRTKKDHPLIPQLQACDSPGAILAVLQQQVLELYRSRSDRLIKWLYPTIRVIYVFSATLVAPSVFAGIGALLLGAKDQDALVDILGRVEIFFRRLEAYTDVPQTTEMVNIFIQIVVEVLFILGVATKEIKRGRTKKFIKKLTLRTDVEDALKRLDELTQEVVQMASPQT